MYSKFIENLSLMYDVQVDGDNVTISDNGSTVFGNLQNRTCFIKHISSTPNNENAREMIKRIIGSGEASGVTVQMTTRAINDFLEVSSNLNMASNWFNVSKTASWQQDIIKILDKQLHVRFNESLAKFEIPSNLEEFKTQVISEACHPFIKTASNQESSHLIDFVNKHYKINLSTEKVENMKKIKTDKIAQILPITPVNPNQTQINTYTKQLQQIQTGLQQIQRQMEILERQKANLNAQASSVQLKINNLNKQTAQQPVNIQQV